MRVIGVDLDDDDQAFVRRKLGMKLGKFATSIERITVRVTDSNGPRGGVDQVCNVKVVLSGLPSVVVRSVDTWRCTPPSMSRYARRSGRSGRRLGSQAHEAASWQELNDRRHLGMVTINRILCPVAQP